MNHNNSAMYDQDISTFSDYGRRAINDIMKSERTHRLAAEHTTQKLMEILMEAASRMDGDLLEEIRLKDPQAPQNWRPENWSEYWRRASARKGWGGNAARLEKSIEKLRAEKQSLATRSQELGQEILRLRGCLEDGNKKIASLETEITALKAKHRKEKDSCAGKTKEKTIDLDEERPAGPIDPAGYRDLVMEATILKPQVGALKVPATYRERLKVSNNLQYCRKLMTIYLMACKGISIRLECDLLLGILFSVEERAGSTRAALDDLENAGFVSSQTLVLEQGMMGSDQPVKTSLTVLRLTEDGIRLARFLDWDPVPSELERLEGTAGGQDEKHTMATLLFTLHARRRGWKVTILPEVAGEICAEVLAGKGDERYYVSIPGGPTSDEDWQHLAALNNGRVALCTINPENREENTGQCRMLGLGGMATDVCSLVFKDAGMKTAYVIRDISPQMKLWVQEW
jgi:hypothetical protein